MKELVDQFPVFLLIFSRVLSFFVTAPIFSYRNIPNALKLGLAFFLSWTMMFTLDFKGLDDINSIFVMLLLKEVLVGLMIGLVASIITYAFQVAGGFIDMQVGFSIANVIDPQTGIQSPLTGRYLYTIAIVFMFAVNGHHLLLDGIYYSYQFIPLKQMSIPFSDPSLYMQVLKAVTTMFVVAFQMAIPIVGSLFLVDVALGIVARTVPQVNVFVVGLPLKVLVGFALLLLTMPVFVMLIGHVVEEMAVSMRDLMRLIGAV